VEEVDQELVVETEVLRRWEQDTQVEVEVMGQELPMEEEELVVEEELQD
jgi:hypothetical protein